MEIVLTSTPRNRPRIKPSKFITVVAGARNRRKIVMVTNRPPPIRAKVAKSRSTGIIKTGIFAGRKKPIRSRRTPARVNFTGQQRSPSRKLQTKHGTHSSRKLPNKPRQIRGAEISERSARQITELPKRTIAVTTFRKKATISTRRSPKQSIAPDFNVLNVDDFGRGDTVDIRTRKGGVRQVSLTSADGRKRTKFNIPSRKEQTRVRKLKIARGTKRIADRHGVGLKTQAQITRKRQGSDRALGSDFNIFQVSAVGGRAQVTRRTTRTNRAGVRRVSGIPQTARKPFSQTRKPRATARTSEQRGQRIGSKRLPLNQRSGELKREFGRKRQGSDFDIFRVAKRLPLFVPRELARPNSPLRRGLELTPAGQIGKFVSERVSNKPLAKKDRAFGSDFDVLNLF